MKYYYIGILLFLSTIGIGFSQEVCNNGIDDDGDGFIDCYDSDCSNNSDCDGFFIGNDASCEVIPSEFPEFTLTQDFASDNKTANHLGRIAVGDLDRDGIPEIASQNRYTNKIYLLNGDDATVKYEATITAPRWRMSMANVEDDDCGEVFAISYSNKDYKIVAFDCQLNQLWESEYRDKDPVHIGYADFDQDGQVEMYYKDEIRDPIDGTRLVAGNDGNWDNINGGPVAVDIIGDDDLELVSGGTIYSVSLGARTADAGSITAIATIPGFYAVKRKESATSIADYNLDGFLDVIISGEDNSGVTTVYFWDVQNNTVQTFNDAFGTGDYEYGWKQGTGRLNVGDLDGDGLMNVSFVSGKYLYALDENWNQKWRVVINEETSGYTGCTLFDFNGDGKTEVVYRDEQWLYIINGTDGSIFTQMACISRTNVEHPVVVDVDADGSTEICIVCGTDDVASWANFNDLSYSENSQVRVFKSNGEPWVPARRVWNQHGFFNVNINDDLSVPQFQQQHHLTYSYDVCSDGPNRPLNGFLNQSPFLNSEGCPTYASPDLSFITGSLAVTPPNCPETDFIVSFQLENLGDIPAAGDVPISFYDGDPEVAGATYLGTETLVINLNVNESMISGDITVTGLGAPFTLYIALNDNGSTIPTPIVLPNAGILECDYTDNIISSDVEPVPFPLVTITTNNIVCGTGSVPATGSASAAALIGSVEFTAGYTFNWYNGSSVTATPDFVGAVYSGLTAGDYTVSAVNDAANCGSEVVQVTITNSTTTVSAVITQDQGNDQCVNYNGILSVIINGGEPVGSFDYEWYEGNTVGGGLVISNSEIAQNLNSGTYTVLVTEKATGCQTIESFSVDDNTSTPVITASGVDIVCSDLNSGSISATIGGATTGYSFEWFIGSVVKPMADYTTSSVSNLPSGDYTVVVTEDASDCESASVTVTINQSTAPSIDSSSATDNTSCDSTRPNGTVTMSFTGNATDFVVEWFLGANTLSTKSVGTGTSLSGLAAGLYTVELTEISTGCTDTQEVTISNNVVVPTISALASDVTACAPYNGSVTVSVDLDNLTDYTFSWYDGTAVKATPDYSETSNILSEMPSGFYTVSAFHTTKFCQAVAITIEVVENTPAITITQNSTLTSLPTACALANGSFVVDISAAGNVSGFNVEWFRGTDTSGTTMLSQNGVFRSTLNSLVSDFYTVRATNIDNGCDDTETLFLPFADAHDLVLNSVANATTCVPNNDGVIVVDLTPTPLAGFDESDYSVNLYQGTIASGTPAQTQVGIAGISSYTFNGLSTDSYIIEAIETNPTLSGCSIMITAEVGIDAVEPLLSASNITPNSGCTLNAASGSITLDIDGSSDPNDYSFSWFEGSDTTGDPLGTTVGTVAGTNGETAQDLNEGYFTVEVLNIVTQCTASLSAQVVSDQPVIAMQLNFSDVDLCGTVTDGSADVSIIFNDGTNDNPLNYTYKWIDENATDLGITTATTTGLTEGSYNVTATDIISECSVSSDFEIINDDSADPVVSLISFQNPTQCLQPGNLLGELAVDASGVSMSGYNFNWYAGSTNSGTIISPTNSFTGQSFGQYTVEVTDIDSPNCRVTETYELVLEVIPVSITASATPLTRCDSPDGSVYATATSGSPNNYSYDWTLTGSSTTFSGRNVNGLAEGVYTVVATDIADAACISPAQIVTIANAQIFPNLQVDPIAPLTVCDLTRANGVAKATVDGGFVGYTFDWYLGGTVSSTIVYTGVEYSNMDSVQYTVRATDNVSQCYSDSQVTIDAEIPGVVDPEILILSDVTSCIEENGVLTVSVEGNTSGYLFDWYNGNQVTGTPDFTGESYSSLSKGEYTVKATSTVTGCESGTTIGVIVEDKQLPEFDVETGSATCDLPTGYALILLTNGVEIETVEWNGVALHPDGSTSPISTSYGPGLLEVLAGTYNVLVTTAEGCTAFEDGIEVRTEVNPYNGVSRNGDGNNDIFMIDCIVNYPDNMVKIFNRAGTLVYEGSGYDNSTTYFDGISNKGVSPMGKDLPDGTYFFIIDKKDGSTPVNGYIELVK